jgi:UDP-3-O-[3-hydroxymyristoyl] glucosamine N-acyltransferase
MHRQLLSVALLLMTLTPLTAFAKGDNDRASIGSDITVAEGENAGDIACIFCSVHVHGDVSGDAAVILGSLTVDSGHKIGGDAAVIGGDLNLAEGAEIGGNAAIIAGDANLGPGAMVHGDRTVLPGRGWLLVPFIPLLVLIGIIWLIIHFTRRRYQFPVYPHGRGL